MKKIFTLALFVVPFACSAQYYFPTAQRSVFAEDGVYTCTPCYTWTVPMFDSFKSWYGDNLIYYSQEYMGYSIPISTNACSWLYSNAYTYPLGVATSSPYMYLNQAYLSQTEGDSTFIAKARHVIDSTNAIPAVASPIFSVTNVGTDSMIVTTMVKFLQPADGEYHITILLLQDSVYYMAAGAPGGYAYHMHRLTGPEYEIGMTDWKFQSNDSMSYTLANGPIAAGTIFTNTFHFKMKSTQVLSQMRPLAVVWKFDTVRLYDLSDGTTYDLERFNYVNANEKPGFYTTTNASQSMVTAYTATVYPNPAQNSLQVKVEGVPDEVILKISDIMGRTVLTQKAVNGETVDISSLSDGQYIYNFTVKGSVIANGKVNVAK